MFILLFTVLQGGALDYLACIKGVIDRNFISTLQIPTATFLTANSYIIKINNIFILA